jgi:hypothetical protein
MVLLPPASDRVGPRRRRILAGAAQDVADCIHCALVGGRLCRRNPYLRRIPDAVLPAAPDRRWIGVGAPVGGRWKRFRPLLEDGYEQVRKVYDIEIFLRRSESNRF